jgi:hypothetical protein
MHKYACIGGNTVWKTVVGGSSHLNTVYDSRNIFTDAHDATIVANL